MYYYIKGKIIEINKNSVIVDNHGIGYHIHFFSPYLFHLEQEVKLFLYYYIKDNIRDLYGFTEIKFLSFFKKLISIPGIGPKSAIVITNVEFFQETQNAIKQNNIAYLMKFPGIGKKTAQQIIFHLQNNLVTPKTQTNTFVLNPKQNDVKYALMNLGFNAKQVEHIIYKIDSNQSLELMIKEALKLLINK
ncbi:Holliday junction branch migration protein RuvA [Italian clover phyllody phytoplasma]|uniref:Holliday junction branch migration protein RuvA n=1 Tax=Italian clover phyllody phytoplasma TaxID=1196420 RepID=UPI0002D6565C|nr:Holliday junction branch migration protein RuvA [Italian clover phyllody phytoplasma]